MAEGSGLQIHREKSPRQFESVRAFQNERRMKTPADVMIDAASIELVRILLEMESVCYNEGIGPDTTDLMLAIVRKYPELGKEYSWMLGWLPETNIESEKS